jgi:hypothetical protein
MREEMPSILRGGKLHCQSYAMIRQFHPCACPYLSPSLFSLLNEISEKNEISSKRKTGGF